MLRARASTRDGCLVIWGSLVQVPAALFFLWKAWLLFPNSDELLASGLMHLAAPVALVGSWFSYGRQLGFRPTAVLTALLALLAAMPFLFSLLLVP
ncbi:hypothetical protein D0B54_09980 [Solimonas sp. K1W22B-7]|nr:hypothetical protein D0B54_09980 [Solimonas sp. K1W22B-7]